MMAGMSPSPYVPGRPGRSEFSSVRGLRYHSRHWGDAGLATAQRPPLVLLHGWMDVAASFQFVVDALSALEGESRLVIAPDWRGFGLTGTPPGDTYWFPDYLGDLDQLLDQWLGPPAEGRQVDLLGHSMGGNVAMLYAGIRPRRIRRLVNLEGFGLPAAAPSLAPRRYAVWLDELKQPQELSRYPDLDAVAARLRKTNPLLRADRAAWLAAPWARQEADGSWHILGDPVHKRSQAQLYRKDEALACWACIEAPLLWVEGDRTDIGKWWGPHYPAAEFHERLKAVRQVEKHVLSPAGHMLHHDQPEALAQRLLDFLA